MESGAAADRKSRSSGQRPRRPGSHAPFVDGSIAEQAPGLGRACITGGNLIRSVAARSSSFRGPRFSGGTLNGSPTRTLTDARRSLGRSRCRISVPVCATGRKSKIFIFASARLWKRSRSRSSHSSVAEKLSSLASTGLPETRPTPDPDAGVDTRLARSHLAKKCAPRRRLLDDLSEASWRHCFARGPEGGGHGCTLGSACNAVAGDRHHARQQRA
jgi:hypothetical protein